MNQISHFPSAISRTRTLLSKLRLAKLHEVRYLIQYTQRFCSKSWNHDNFYWVQQLINSRQNETSDFPVHHIFFTPFHKTNDRSVFKTCLSYLQFSSQPHTLNESNSTFVFLFLNIFSTPNSSTPPISIIQIENKQLLSKLTPAKLRESR